MFDSAASDRAGLTSGDAFVAAVGFPRPSTHRQPADAQQNRAFGGPSGGIPTMARRMRPRRAHFHYP